MGRPGGRAKSGKGKGKTGSSSATSPTRRLKKGGKRGRRLCQEEGCTLCPSFGFEGEVAVSCSHHKEAGMRNLTARRCQHEGCFTVANFGMPGDKPGFCAQHSTEGMINRNKPRTEAALAGAIIERSSRRTPKASGVVRSGSGSADGRATQAATRSSKRVQGAPPEVGVPARKLVEVGNEVTSDNWPAPSAISSHSQVTCTNRPGTSHRNAPDNEAWGEHNNTAGWEGTQLSNGHRGDVTADRGQRMNQIVNGDGSTVACGKGTGVLEMHQPAPTTHEDMFAPAFRGSLPIDNGSGDVEPGHRRYVSNDGITALGGSADSGPLGGSASSRSPARLVMDTFDVDPSADTPLVMGAGIDFKGTLEEMLEASGCETDGQPIEDALSTRSMQTSQARQGIVGHIEPSQRLPTAAGAAAGVERSSLVSLSVITDEKAGCGLGGGQAEQQRGSAAGTPDCFPVSSPSPSVLSTSSPSGAATCRPLREVVQSTTMGIGENGLSAISSPVSTCSPAYASVDIPPSAPRPPAEADCEAGMNDPSMLQGGQSGPPAVVTPTEESWWDVFGGQDEGFVAMPEPLWGSVFVENGGGNAVVTDNVAANDGSITQLPTVPSELPRQVPRVPSVHAAPPLASPRPVFAANAAGLSGEGFAEDAKRGSRGEDTMGGDRAGLSPLKKKARLSSLPASLVGPMEAASPAETSNQRLLDFSPSPPPSAFRIASELVMESGHQANALASDLQATPRSPHAGISPVSTPWGSSAMHTPQQPTAAGWA